MAFAFVFPLFTFSFRQIGVLLKLNGKHIIYSDTPALEVDPYQLIRNFKYSHVHCKESSQQHHTTTFKNYCFQESFINAAHFDFLLLFI